MTQKEQDALAKFPTQVLRFLATARCHTSETHALILRLLDERESRESR